MSTVARIRPLFVVGLAFTLFACGGSGGGTSSGITTIPSGVILYGTTDANNRETLFTLDPSTGIATELQTYGANVQVLATNASGNRLAISKPLADGTAHVGLFLTDLNGVSSPVRMGALAVTKMNDVAITSLGDVVSASSASYNVYASSGTDYNMGLAGVSGCAAASSNGTGTEGVFVFGSQIVRATIPDRSNETQLIHGGSYAWVRYSPDGTRVAFTDGSDVYVMLRDGSGKQKVATAGSYPTFGANASTLYFSRVGDGVYRLNLTTSTESRIAAVSGTWDGRIFYH